LPKNTFFSEKRRIVFLETRTTEYRSYYCTTISETNV
jgi:hypothetical protein